MLKFAQNNIPHLYKDIKLSGRVFDFYDDPEFLKQAHDNGWFDNKKLLHPNKIDKLPDNYFLAKIAGNTKVKRILPIYSEESLKLASKYLKASKPYWPDYTFNELGNRLNDILNQEGIKEASLQIDCVPKNKVPVNPEKLILKEAKYIKQAFPFMSPSEKVKECTKLFKAASRFNVDIKDSDLLDYVKSDKPGSCFSQGLAKRASYIKHIDNPMITNIWADTLKQLEEAPPMDEAIQIIESFDKIAGIDPALNQDIIDAHRTMFGGKTFINEPPVPPEGINKSSRSITEELLWDFAADYSQKKYNRLDAHQRGQGSSTVMFKPAIDKLLDEFCQDPVTLYFSDNLPPKLKNLITRIILDWEKDGEFHPTVFYKALK